MENLVRLESVREITRIPHREDVLFVITGELLNELRVELEKGDRARWLLEEIVALGSPEPEPVFTITKKP